MTSAARSGDGSAVTQKSALTLLASHFFMWGFITVINNTLLPHLRSVFDLNYTRTTLIESTWFIAYFVASLPSAKLIEKIGCKRAMVTGLVVMAIAGGALVVVQGQIADAYGPFLLTAVCELYVLFYALWGCKPTVDAARDSGSVSDAA